MQKSFLANNISFEILENVGLENLSYCVSYT